MRYSFVIGDHCYLVFCEAICKGLMHERIKLKDSGLCELRRAVGDWVSFAPDFQCCYFCESSCFIYLSFNFNFKLVQAAQ